MTDTGTHDSPAGGGRRVFRGSKNRGATRVATLGRVALYTPLDAALDADATGRCPWCIEGGMLHRTGRRAGQCMWCGFWFDLDDPGAAFGRGKVESA